MDFYAPTQRAPSTFATLTTSSINNPSARSMQPALPRRDDWHLRHAAPSLSRLSRDTTDLDDAMWQMPLQSQQGVHIATGPFPERFSEPDCAYYMRTGLCGFGMSCRFNHPSKLKMAASIGREKGEYPERIGQPECQYYLKTGSCKFGGTCKYHHPRDKAGVLGRVALNVLGLPLRPGERDCAYYLRTGSCKFRVTCKFNHPQPAPVGALVSLSGSPLYSSAGSPSVHLGHIFPGGMTTWPIVQTPYIPGPSLQGSSSFSPLILPPQSVVSVPRWSTYQGPVGSLASPEGQQQALKIRFMHGVAPQIDTVATGMHGMLAPYVRGSSMGLPALEVHSSSAQKENVVFPERPDQPVCQYYMKTGDCKFRMVCRYHHPKGRAASIRNCPLSPIGLPLRLGAPLCTFYTRYGTCKFGPTCKFDHPMGGLTYSPSASSLVDMPIAPYPIGSSPPTIVPSISETHTQTSSSTLKDLVVASGEEGPFQHHSEDKPPNTMKNAGVASPAQAMNGSVESGKSASRAKLRTSS